METINFTFKIAALMFLLIFVLVNHGKLYLQTLQNKLYRGMIWLFMLLNLIDALLDLFHYYYTDFPVVPLHILNMAYLFIYLAIPEIFLIYALSIINQPKKYYKKEYLKYKGTLFIYLGLLIITPFTGLVYSIGENNAYIKGPLYGVICALVAYHMLLTVSIIQKQKDEIDKRERSICQIIIVSLAISVLLHLLMPANFLLIPLTEVTSIMVLHFVIQAPEYYIDKETGLFNAPGFIKMISEMGKEKNEKTVLAICFEEISKTDRAKIMQVIKSELAKYIFQMSGQNCYVCGQEVYIICDTERIADNLTSVIMYRAKESFMVKEQEIVLGMNVLSINNLCDLDGADEIFNIVAFYKANIFTYGSVSYYDIDLEKKIKRREAIKVILTEAIYNDGIAMFYQPIYSVERDQMDTAECLVRLKDNQTIGFISPEEFIPIAEEENLILPLEDLILNNVCSFIQREELYKKNLKYIDVNLSGKQCKERSLSDKLISVVKKYDIPPNFINLEITETSAVTTNQRLIYNMEKLKNVGITFSLDDFGSGYSNFQNLTALPFNVGKIDKSLVWSYFESEKGKIILRNVIPMLKQLGTVVLAEGVETKEQKDILIEMGVLYLQGYYFSRPLPEEEYLKIVNG